MWNSKKIERFHDPKKRGNALKHPSRIQTSNTGHPQLSKVPEERMALLHDVRYRALFYQCLAVVFVVILAWSMFTTASQNLAKQDIATGFSYLSRQAGFVISETAIAYEPTDTVARALLVGIANTVAVVIKHLS